MRVRCISESWLWSLLVGRAEGSEDGSNIPRFLILELLSAANLQKSIYSECIIASLSGRRFLGIISSYHVMLHHAIPETAFLSNERDWDYVQFLEKTSLDVSKRLENLNLAILHVSQLFPFFACFLFY